MDSVWLFRFIAGTILASLGGIILYAGWSEQKIRTELLLIGFLALFVGLSVVPRDWPWDDPKVQEATNG